MSTRTLLSMALGIVIIGCVLVAGIWKSQSRQESAVKAKAQAVATALSQQAQLARVALKQEFTVAVLQAPKGRVVTVPEPAAAPNAARLRSLPCPRPEAAPAVQSGAEPASPAPTAALSPGFYAADDNHRLGPLNVPDVTLTIVQQDSSPSRGALLLVVAPGQNLWLAGTGPARPAATLAMSTSDGQRAHLAVLSDGTVQVMP